MAYARDRASVIVAVGGDVEGAAQVVPLPRADTPSVSLLVETGVVELVAAELWRRGVAAGDPALAS